MSSLLQDVRYAFRGLRRAPGLTAAVMVTLGLGIGSTTAIFSVVYGVLLRPLPFPDSERVVRLCEVRPSLPGVCGASAVNVADMAAASPAIESAGVARDDSFVFVDGDRTLNVFGAIATPGFLHVHGAVATHGRLLADEDLPKGANQVAVVSHRFWEARLGGAPEAVGRLVTIDSLPVRVIGVLSPSVYIPGFLEADVWMPLTTSIDDVGNRAWRGFIAVAKARPGISRDAFSREIVSIHERLRAAYPAENGDWTIRDEGLRDRMVAPVRQTLWVFQGAALLVLLVACANAAGLLLVRATARAPEFAVRIALGAGRRRLLRQLLVEGALLSTGGLLIGLAATTWATAGLVALAPRDIPRLSEVAFSSPIALLAALAAVATTMIIGLAPLRQPRQITAVLRGQRNSGERVRLRSGFVFVQLSLACALLLGASLLTGAFIQLARWNPGFEKDHLFISWLVAPPATYQTTSNAVVALALARDRVAVVPGVIDAGLTSAGPMFGGTEGDALTVNGVTRPEPVLWYDVDEHYFQTLGAHVQQGRPLSADDTLSAPAVAVVNESFVRTFFPDASPIGQRVTVQDHAADIVGVYPDFTPARPDEPVTPQIYWPIQQYRRFAAYLVLRLSPDSAMREDAIRDAIRGAGPAIQMTTVTSLDTMFERTLVNPKFNMAILGLFAIMAVALAAVGVHGVIAFSVTSRTREIGVRVALGASPARVARQFLIDTSRLAIAGALAGVVLAAVLGRWLDHLLVGLPSLKPLWVIGLVIAFVGVALLAGYIPARRASRVDPVKALAAD